MNIGLLGLNRGMMGYARPSRHKEPKWVTLHNDSLSLMQLNECDVDFLKGKKIKEANVKEKFIPGHVYYIEREPIEGVEFDRLYFMLYGIVNNYKGINLNSLVVREVELNENGEFVDSSNASGRRKFSISPSMCKLFGIEYKPGFELWPISSDFKEVDIDEILEEDKEIVYSDMSTYPVSSIDGTIRTILLELHGFSGW